MTSESFDVSELDDLMRAARNRVAHLIAIVVMVMVAITSQISFDVARLGALLVWMLGCTGVLVLAEFWYRARVADTVRLVAALQSGNCAIFSVEITHLRLYVLPIGVEVDVELGSGDHLSLGYWTESTAQRLAALLAPLQRQRKATANRASSRA